MANGKRTSVDGQEKFRSRRRTRADAPDPRGAAVGSTAARPAPAAGPGAHELFQLLRDGRSRSRAELAELTGLARSTVGLRLDALAGIGLVGPALAGASTGGRPPSRVALVPEARLVLAVDVGATHVQLALTDLVGRVLVSRAGAVSVADGPERTLQHVLDGADELLGELGRGRGHLVGIGIGLPGPVHFETGRPSNPPLMPGWDGFDVPAWFARHVRAHVLVDNDVNIMALGEHSRHWPDSEPFLFAKVATGIGAGTISGGRLQRGAQGIAGDIGHVRVSRGDGVRCTCGNEGCLEALASGAAVAARLRREGLAVRGSADVVDLVRAGDPRATRAVRQAGRDLGEVLAACVSLVNPSVIAVGGRMAGAGEHLLSGVREAVRSRATPLATGQLRIVASLTGAESGLVGASILAIDHALSPEGMEAFAAAP